MTVMLVLHTLVCAQIHFSDSGSALVHMSDSLTNKNLIDSGGCDALDENPSIMLPQNSMF